MTDIILEKWSIKDKFKLNALCNSIDRSFLSDRLPYPYTDKDAEAWLSMVSELDICRITGLVFAENTASARVLEKNGFKLEGMMKQAVIKNGIIHDLLIFGRLKTM